MTRPATLTQAEIARAAKVVKAERVAMTITTIDGTIYRLMPVDGRADLPQPTPTQSGENSCDGAFGP